MCTGCTRNKLSCHWPEDKPSSKGTRSAASCSSSSPGDTSNVDESVGAALSSRFDRACTLTPESFLLLRFYLSEMGHLLATQPIHKNPFITHIAPLAYGDDLLMHAVLALSGTNLAFRDSSDDRIETATLQHYSTAIIGLRKRVGLIQTNTTGENIRLLLLLLVVCHYEAFSGSEYGTVFPHLRACRLLITSIREGSLKELGSESELFGLCLELYSYITISNMVTSYGTMQDGAPPCDEFLFSLDELSVYSTFGSMFGGYHGLFELIPHVALFASERMVEEQAGFSQLSPRLQETHDNLAAKIRIWHLPETEDPSETSVLKIQRRAAAEVLRDGLFVYLTATSCGSQPPADIAKSKIHFHIEAMIHNLKQLTLPQVCSNLMWPVLIAGSCTEDEKQRRVIGIALQDSLFLMRHTSVACKMLNMLWQNPAPEAYGPYGLHLIEKKGFWLPVI